MQPKPLTRCLMYGFCAFVLNFGISKDLGQAHASAQSKPTNAGRQKGCSDDMKSYMDSKEMQAALREYSKATKKDEADILNRAGRNWSLRSAQFTVFAKAGKIISGLKKDNIAVKLLARQGAFRGISIRDRSKVVSKWIARRVLSAKYIRVGFMKAAQAFGANLRSGGKLSPKGDAARGYGTKATYNKLVAVIANNSKGADTVALDPMKMARDFVIKDMQTYARRKMAQSANKYSAK